MKKLICLMLIATMCVTEISAIEGISARSAILMTENGEVLWENNADERLEPASVTKIMTLILVAEAIEDERINLDDVITVSQYASSMGGSQIWLKEGEQMSVRDMLKALVVVSANDAATALAECIGGTEETFVRMMNDKAEELGMTNTTFVNCNGLDAEGHLTTARDIAIMSREALKHDIIFEYTKIWMDYIRNGESVLVNTNKMIRKYAGMTGLKTGYTSSAGYCLSATAERDGLSLIAVTMKNSTTDERTADITAMLNYGFTNYKCIDVQEKTEIPEISVQLGKQEYVATKLATDEKLVVAKNDENIEFIAEVDEKIKAPIAEDQKVGELTVKSDGKILKTIDIVASETVEKLTLKEIFTELMCIVLSR
ncbi:MAG: D-alanyl-D-alanine carboxypeptidase [Clostridia bacterium]|nr:D-alanyl-D-alanine carboxypeptidase [Clostridia bacterium]